MMCSSSHPTLPDTYMVPFEMTAWAVVEVDQTGRSRKLKRRTEDRKRGDSARDVVDNLLGHGGKRKGG